MNPFSSLRPVALGIAAMLMGAVVPDASAASVPGHAARVAPSHFRGAGHVAPLHRAGHFRPVNHPRRHWGGSVWLGPSWGYGNPWFDPWVASIGYRRHGIGVFLPVLPLGYTRLWANGDPYYYADDVYYVRERDGYRAVEPPDGEHRHDEPARRDGPVPSYAKAPPSPTDALVITPEKGQSATQKTFDRIDCERAAIARTGFDPNSATEGALRRADYVKDVSSCLVGKGYAVR